MNGDRDTAAHEPARMTEAAPFNDLGQFRLGKERLRAGQHTEAVSALTRAVALNPKLAEAYLICGEAYEKANQADMAIDILRRGMDVALAGGDTALHKLMATRLEQLCEQHT